MFLARFSSTTSRLFSPSATIRSRSASLGSRSPELAREGTEKQEQIKVSLRRAVNKSTRDHNFHKSKCLAKVFIR